MVDMRKMGYMIHELAKEKAYSEVAQTLDCAEDQVHDLYDGRYFLSFEQVENLAAFLGCEPNDFFCVDEAQYSANAVHCMGSFSDEGNREKILDFIDLYIDARNAVNEKQ